MPCSHVTVIKLFFTLLDFEVRFDTHIKGFHHMMESLEEEDNEDDGEKVFRQFSHIQSSPQDFHMTGFCHMMESHEDGMSLR